MESQKAISILLVIICLSLIATSVGSLENIAKLNDNAGGFVTEFTIPQPSSNPQNLAIEATGPPAVIWFTMMGANAIGNLVLTSTVDFAFTSYSLMPNSDPFDIVYDNNTNAVWFTESGGNRIGRLDIETKAITEIAIPAGHSSPKHIDIASNGSVWFTEPAANQVVRYQPSTQTFTSFPYDFPNSTPNQIEVLHDNSVWVTLQSGNRVAELKVDSGRYVNIPVGDIGSPTFAPGALALDGSNPWITAPTKNRIGRYAPGTVSFWNWYILPVTADNMAYRNFNDMRELWFTSTAIGKVGYLLLNAQGEVVSSRTSSVPTFNSEPTDIDVDINGVVWITESKGNNIARWQLPYFYEIFLPLIN